MYLLAFRGVHIDFRAQIKGKSSGMFSKFSKILKFLPHFNFFRICAEQLLMMINVYNQVVASNGWCNHLFFQFSSSEISRNEDLLKEYMMY